MVLVSFGNYVVDTTHQGSWNSGILDIFRFEDSLTTHKALLYPAQISNVPFAIHGCEKLV